MAQPKRKTGQDDGFDRSTQQEADIVAMPMIQAASIENSSQPKLRIGEILKRERERCGYDLGQIADYLCIRRGLLVAIENSRYEEFPADAYVIGFLRSYANLIGIDGQKAIGYYREEMAGRHKKPDLVMPTPISGGRAPTAVILAAAAVASLLVYVMWYAFSTSDRATVTKPPSLPAVSETTPLPEAPTPDASALAPPATSEPIAPPVNAISPVAVAPTASATPSIPAASPVTTGKIVIRADQSSWVLVANGKGQTIYDHVMKAGESYDVPNQPGLVLTTGNGAGIIVTVDGVDLPRLSSTASHIVRNVPLDPQALKTLPATP